MPQAILIDARRFSRENRFLEGALCVAELPRLADLLTGFDGEITWKLTGLTNEHGQPRLRLEVAGSLSLRCQRCLETVEEPLAIDSLLDLIPEGAEPTQDEMEDDRLDFLPVGKNLEVTALIEDEILLALPIVPRHATCGLPTGIETEKSPRPFAVLADLKDRRT